MSKYLVYQDTPHCPRIFYSAKKNKLFLYYVALPKFWAARHGLEYIGSL